jgi:adenine-specific DNA methylase
MAEKMPDDGMQVVMFTHQDAGVWADLARILWSAGLRVTAAWCIGTETSSGLKQGNYVQGTVILVLRKRSGGGNVAEDDLLYQVEDEVKRQLDSMTEGLSGALDFGDSDLQLAAYGAALRALTQYESVDGKSIGRSREMAEGLINQGVRVACSHLIPLGFDEFLWRRLSPEERFYLKCLDAEAKGERRIGVYQELAKGFGLAEYKDFLFSSKANDIRVRTATEWAGKNRGSEGFGKTLLRETLFAIFLTAENGGNVDRAMAYLHSDLRDRYWANRGDILAFLRLLGCFENLTGMEHWHADVSSALALTTAVGNDMV